MQITPDEPRGIVKISGTADAAEAEALRTALQQWLGRAAFDLSGVDQCDTTAVQLLWSARATAMACGQPFRILALSESLADLVSSLGLSLDPAGAEPDPAGSVHAI